MLNINKKFQLNFNEGSSVKANINYIIIHDTGNDNNKGLHSGRNEAQYMKNHWQEAYTHAIVDDECTYLIGEDPYIAYGAGTVANSRSPFQIELAHVNSQKRFDNSYQRYIEAIKFYAKKYNIPLTLDTGITENGIKSHDWVSKNIWGDHSDPWGYLKKWGITKNQFAKDIGVSNSTNSKSKNNIYYQHGNQVIALTSVSRYSDLGFRQKVDTYPKGTIFDIWQTVKYGTITRFKLANGLYITSNTKYVKKIK